MRKICHPIGLRGQLLFAILVAFVLSVPHPDCFAAGGDRKLKVYTAWSATSPAINETHLFEGFINRKGDPVGFHSRPGGRDPRGARVANVTDTPNKAGIYTAQVEIRASGNRWLSKQSTFFPDNMTRKEVVQAVLHAYQHATTRNSVKFSGPSGKGFIIAGYLLQDGKINTAFPLYRRDQ
jgi:hypothetical protein